MNLKKNQNDVALVNFQHALEIYKELNEKFSIEIAKKVFQKMLKSDIN
jgi:hypothetical protein